MVRFTPTDINVNGIPVKKVMDFFGLKIGDEVEIADILWNGEEVVLSIPNKQDLAGKSLVFSIKMVSVAK